MTGNMEELELKERLSLIENMIAEARRSTASWGWTFVLWGVAYYIAIAWSTLGHSNLAWPVTMIAAGIVTGIGASRNHRSEPRTTLGRALGAVWWCMGISMFVLMFSLSVSGRYEIHLFAAIITALLGTANATSSIILKWKMQFACAVVWWATSVVSCFATENQTGIMFLAAIFLCQIVFGIYCMIAEARERKQVTAHA
jgi:hypothetical protein